MTAPLLGTVSLALLREALDDFTVDARLRPARTSRAGGAPAGRPGRRRAGTAQRASGWRRWCGCSCSARRSPSTTRGSRCVRSTSSRRTTWSTCAAARLRARLEVRPYATDGRRAVVGVLRLRIATCDPGPLAPDHVLGIGAASLTLAQATVRRSVRAGPGPRHRLRRAGTACGHARRRRWLPPTSASGRFGTQRRLRSCRVRRGSCRHGSLLDPVRDERFDLVVANPPFVVSPGFDRDSGGYDYRDSGLAGDAASAALVAGVPALLEHRRHGVAARELDRPGRWRLGGPGRGMARRGTVRRVGVATRDRRARAVRDAVAARRRRGSRGRRAGTRVTTAGWTGSSARASPRSGMGLVTMWRNDGPSPQVVCEDVPQRSSSRQAATSTRGWDGVVGWPSHDDATLLGTRLRHAARPRARTGRRGRRGRVDAAALHLRQTTGMRWEIAADDAMAGLVAACDGRLSLDVLVDVLAATAGCRDGRCRERCCPGRA